MGEASNNVALVLNPEAHLTFGRFHNALRILLNVDCHELIEAGVLKAEEEVAWTRFRSDPFRFFIRADEATAGRLWNLIERRQPGKR